MSRLEGNPHATNADKRLDGIHDWQAEEGSTDETMRALSMDALTEATLALAYEQRTANLLAFLTWEPMRGVDQADAWLQKQVVERLGLDVSA